VAHFENGDPDYDTKIPTLQAGAVQILDWALQVVPQLTEEFPRLLLPSSEAWVYDLPEVPGSGKRRVTVDWQLLAPTEPSKSKPFWVRADVTVVDTAGTHFVAFVCPMKNLDDAGWLLVVHQGRKLILDADNGSATFDQDSHGLVLRNLALDGLDDLLEIGVWLRQHREK
jgi:hypothetical protein